MPKYPKNPKFNNNFDIHILAQASYFRLNLLSSLTVQVDGEPWEQPAGEMVIAQTGLQAKMLKKSLKKRK